MLGATIVPSGTIMQFQGRVLSSWPMSGAVKLASCAFLSSFAGSSANPLALMTHNFYILFSFTFT